MPENTKHMSISAAWIDFTSSVKILLIPQQDDRGLDQYLTFRDKVFTLIEDEKFLSALDEAWPQFTDFPKDGVGQALLMELKSFPLAVEVAATTTDNTSRPSKGWHKKWLSRASTITGSVKDILDTLPDWAKNSITVFKELVDIFKV